MEKEKFSPEKDEPLFQQLAETYIEQAKINKLNLHEGDIIISKSGTKRTIQKIEPIKEVVDSEYSGGYFIVNKEKNNIKTQELITFRRLLDALDKNIVHLEKRLIDEGGILDIRVHDIIINNEGEESVVKEINHDIENPDNGFVMLENRIDKKEYKMSFGELKFASQKGAVRKL